MIYIRNDGGRAVVYYDRAWAEKHGYNFSVEELPAGDGLLKTDGKALWWERVLEPEQRAPTDFERAQQDITDLQLADIARGQEITDILLGGVQNA